MDTHQGSIIPKQNRRIYTLYPIGRARRCHDFFLSSIHSEIVTVFWLVYVSICCLVKHPQIATKTDQTNHLTILEPIGCS